LSFEFRLSFDELAPAGAGRHLHVEVGIHVTAVAPHLQGGLRGWRQRHVDVTVERREGHRLPCRQLLQCCHHLAVGGVRDDRAADISERDLAVHVVHLDAAIHALDRHFPAVDRAQHEARRGRHLDRHRDTAQHRRRVDAHRVVLFLDVHTGRLREAASCRPPIGGRSAAGALAGLLPFAFALALAIGIGIAPVGGCNDHVAA
jgi:hypothetical protein